MVKPNLVVSIVVHRSPLPVLEQTLVCLKQAAQKVVGRLVAAVDVVIVDNDSGGAYVAGLQALVDRWQANGLAVRLRCNGANLGYGRGHNMVGTAKKDYRLILNPDVYLQLDALTAALDFLDDHPAVGLVVPRALDAEGKPLYLCKRHPSLLVLALRGFFPVWLQQYFVHILDRYEMRDLDWDLPRFDLELVSGCCMLMRGEVWHRTGGFDPDYFMYFEDFDFSLRAHQVTRIAYVPDFIVTHLGGGAARKGWRHRWWFVRSAWRFFRHYGWKWL
ncbi:hypothetical protein MIN45_P0335 [Methylomarinovum tepidoasis]|uniref:Glycosyltransferase n=1 Tax=Methylomarinovum tepidoasis TaxID=2840183 RepID=A0AAU9CCJ7_9GAMM|nr:glycosyltransferase family 2 protein [Methylomarinovum sp. IN45]BCX87968.1 hypothetical protein MIN45_P0335 [Methylomarinovum sp. IN45]